MNTAITREQFQAVAGAPALAVGMNAAGTPIRTDSNKDDIERYWLFRNSGVKSPEKARALFAALKQS
jgi:hypothetical protein